MNLEAEKIYAQLFREDEKYVDKGKDWPLDGYIWMCPVCGYTYTGEMPRMYSIRQDIFEVLIRWLILGI